MAPSSTPKRIRNQYSVKRRLGKALYGSVYLCDDLQVNTIVAVKEVNLLEAKRRLALNPHMDNPWQERKAAEQLTAIGRHDHILQYRDNFTDNGAWYMVMDYCNGGDLLSVLERQNDGRLPESSALQYFRQVVDGVEHLHSHGIAHRDLSPENVLLHDDVCKLSDFGLSTEADRVCSERVGKAYYMAPEVVAKQEYDPKAADMWSLGILLFILLTGSPLVQIASVKDKGLLALHRFGLQKILDMWGMASNISSETVDLISGLLSLNPSDRLTIDELLAQPALERSRQH